MANQRAEIDVVVNGGQAKSTLNEIAKAVDGVATSAGKSSAAMSKIGEGADAGVDKAINATKRFEQQLKRLNLELESGGKNTAAYIEGRAKLAGADTAALAPLIAQYDQLRAKQAVANSEFTKAGKVMTEYGMGVKATSAALRQVPAQFTDIIVSLQGGQAPLTVLLQQGGQLKDVFGGVGNAAKALGGYVLGLINPFTMAAAAVGTLAYAYSKGAAEAEAYNKALILTGNAAGTTAMRLSDMAQVVAQSTGGTLGAAAGALATLAGATNIATAQFEKIAAVAVQMEKVTGVAVADTVKQFSELGKDPVAASEKLNTTTHYLTAAVYEQIKALEEQGKFLEAGALAQKTWADAMEGRLPALVENLGYVERAWRGITGAAKGAWDAMANVGRPDSDKSIIDALKAKIADAEKNLAYNPGLYGADLKNMREQLVYLQRMEASKGAMAAYDAARVQRDEASIKISKEAEKYATNAVKMKRAVAQADADFANSNKTDKDIENYGTRLAGIAKAFKDTEGAAKTQKAAISEAAKGLALYNDLMDKGAGLTANFAEQQGQLTAKFAKDGNLEEYRNGMAALIKMQPYMVANLKAEADAIAAIEKARNSGIQSHASELEKLNEKAQKLEDEVAMYGMSKEAIEELTTARMLDRIEVLRGFDNSAEEIARIEQTIAARKRLAAAGTAKDMKDESAKAADDMLKEQKRAAEESGKYWTDALMRAFESGKGFFQSLWDTIKNTLKTQVLKVLVSATGLTSMSMAGATDLAGGGGGNLLGTAANLGKMYDTITGGFTKLTATVSGNLQYAADWMMTSQSDLVASLGESLSANVGTLSSVAGYAAGAAAGLAIGKAISGGYGSNTAVNAGTIIGSVVGGPIGGAIGGAIGGLVNRAFGRKATELLSSGTRGTFSGEEFSGVNYANYQKKGGWFRSDKNWTDITAMAAETRDAWSYAFAGVKGSVTGMAASLGLATEQITAYSKYIDVAAGTTEAQITALFTGMADDMARAAAPGIAEFANTGETASVTMSRLATSLQTANMWLTALDQTLFDISLVGGDAASKLADAFGGLENMANASKTYYDLFWTEAERLADTGSNVAKGLALVGVAMPNTKDAFRDVVSALDLTSDAGRNAYAVMLALAPEFAQVADGIAASVNTLFDSIEKRLTELQQSIASERESVAGARAGILLAAPKTAAQLAAEIAATKVAMPSDAGVISAMAARTAAQAGMAAAQSAQSATSSVYGTALSSAQAGLNSTVDKYKNLAAYFQNMAVSFNGYQIKVNATGTNNDAFSYNAGTNQLNPWNSTSDATQTGRAYRHFISDTAAFTAAMTNNGTLGALQGGNADLANSAAAVAAAQAAYNSAMTAATGTLSTATAAKNAADAAAKQAVLDYAAAMTQYSGDAEKAVKVLSTLREETVAYYEAQKELAGLLIASAANLREVVRSTRFGQLDEQAGLAQQQSSFAQNYSLALSTTGATKAGYADQLGAALPGLSTALMDASATRADWALATSSLFAQSDTIAAQLEAEAGAMNYQADSLALLDSIDVSLMELDTNTAILKNAIDGGASSTAAGLRAIVTQLGGVPSFDVGTNYVPQDMFARVHQGEAIVPRAFNPAAMSQGGATAEMVQELRALRTEVAGLRSEAAATAGHTSKTARLLDRAMPDGDALATRVAV